MSMWEEEKIQNDEVRKRKRKEQEKDETQPAKPENKEGATWVNPFSSDDDRDTDNNSTSAWTATGKK